MPPFIWDAPCRQAQGQAHAKPCQTQLSTPPPAAAARRFKHFPIVRAVDEERRSVFCLWDDEELIMRPERFDESLPASGNATNVSGGWLGGLKPAWECLDC